MCTWALWKLDGRKGRKLLECKHPVVRLWDLGDREGFDSEKGRGGRAGGACGSRDGSEGHSLWFLHGFRVEEKQKSQIAALESGRMNGLRRCSETSRGRKDVLEAGGHELQVTSLCVVCLLSSL